MQQPRSGSYRTYRVGLRLPLGERIRAQLGEKRAPRTSDWQVLGHPVCALSEWASGTAGRVRGACVKPTGA